MPMIVLIAAHALRTSDTVNRVTLELHKIDTSSSVELVLETSCGVASGVEYWSTLIKLSSQTVLCEDAVIVAVPGRFRDVFYWNLGSWVPNKRPYTRIYLMKMPPYTHLIWHYTIIKFKKICQPIFSDDRGKLCRVSFLGEQSLSLPIASANQSST